ncbi:MAG: hypothetical protein QME77_13215, partial [bacterium]|nr:hypothetical protein [bacterium]
MIAGMAPRKTARKARENFDEKKPAERLRMQLPAGATPSRVNLRTGRVATGPVVGASREREPALWSYYLMLGHKRSLTAVAKWAGVSTTAIVVMAKKHGWKERLRDFVDIEAEHRKSREREVGRAMDAAMATRHSTLGVKLQSNAEKYLDSSFKEARAGVMSGGEAAVLARTGVQIERESFGLKSGDAPEPASVNVGVSVQQGQSQSQEQSQQLQAALAAAAPKVAELLALLGILRA